jgi:hypothetical protein
MPVATLEDSNRLAHCTIQKAGRLEKRRQDRLVPQILTSCLLASLEGRFQVDSTQPNINTAPYKNGIEPSLHTFFPDRQVK